MSDAPEGVPEPSGPRISPVRLVVSVVAVAVVALLFVLLTADSQTGSVVDSDLLGQRVPDIDGVTLDGEPFDIDDERGKWVVVNFFASWCIPCEQEHPELVAFSENNAGSAIVVSIPFGDTEEGARGFFEEFGGDWPVVLDPSADFAVAFAVRRPPETYLVAPSGLVAQKWIGQITVEALEGTIAAIEEASVDS